MVCTNSPYAFRATTSQDGRQIHVGSLPYFFVCFDITLFPRFSTVYRHVRDLLIQFEVPVDYPWDWHQRQSMVYLRVSMTSTLQSAMLCVGATSDNVQGREATSRRKFIQFARKKLSHFEPALKVFHRKRNFYHGILIALHHEPDGLSLLATEAALTAVELPVGSGCHEGTQDQADQIPTATSQDRTMVPIIHAS